MTSRFGGTLDWMARAFVPQPAHTADKESAVVQYNPDGTPVVYKQRWYILTAFCLGYFTWNLHTYRQTPITPEFALYFDKTNEFQPAPEYGIDFMVITDNLYLLLFYPVAGVLMDRYGIRMMMIGAVGQAISTWWWYVSFTNFGSVMLSRLLSSISGVTIATALLRISSHWFAPSQRALAVAIGTIVSTLGAGAALIFGPLFETGPNVVNIDLKSCKDSFKADLNESLIGTACFDNAEKNFCCAADIDIDLMNLILAIWATLVAIFTIAVAKDAPPTPPSLSGSVKRGPSFFKAVVLMFSKRNYSQICLADFISSGPPLVLYSTISRIFPPRVADYAFLAAAAGIVLAIPASGIFAYYLGKTRKYYEFTAAGYVFGFLCWFAATICLAIGSAVSEYLLIILGIMAVIFFSLWTVSVYELKMEYVFNKDVSLQGFVVAVDRTIINLSSLVFLSAIPPERVDTKAVPGRLFTFLVGSVAMAIGALLVLTIKEKRAYLRIKYEEEAKVDIDELGEDMEIIKIDDTDKKESDDTENAETTNNKEDAEVKNTEKASSDKTKSRHSAELDSKRKSESVVIVESPKEKVKGAVEESGKTHDPGVSI